MESIETFGQIVDVRAQLFLARENESAAGSFLKAMLQHRTILLAKDVIADVDSKFRIDADDVGIVRGMMNLAKPESVRDDRFAQRMAIGLEKLARRRFIIRFI